MWIGPTMNRTKQLEMLEVENVFGGNHWFLMSLVTSWKTCWLNDSTIMLMVFNRRNACNHFFVLKPLGSMGHGIFTNMDGLDLMGKCRYIYSHWGRIWEHVLECFCDRRIKGWNPGAHLLLSMPRNTRRSSGGFGGAEKFSVGEWNDGEVYQLGVGWWMGWVPAHLPRGAK